MGSIDLPDRCYDLDVRGNAMAVATAGKHILVYDVTNQPREHMRRKNVCFTASQHKEKKDGGGLVLQ